MKNSGIEWIGKIPDSWGVKRVKDVFSIIGGCGFKDEFQGHLDGDYPFCKASDINGKDKFLDHAQNYVNQDIVDEQHYKVVPAYSILMSKIGEAMKKNHRKINTVPCIVDNNCQALCKKSNDDIIYLYYLFSQIDMIWFDNGGTIPNISNTKLLNFFIPDISMELQKRIAYHLDKKCGKIDELIANQQGQIEKLKEYKQSVITEAVTKGLDKSAPLKDSGIEWIGEIPAHWELVKIGSIFKCRNEKVNDTDYPPLSVSKGGVVPQMENVAKSDANDNRKLVLKNDFVINSRSDRKQSCGVSPLDGSVSLINTVLYTDNQEIILSSYVNLLMKNYGFAEEFYRWGHGIVADLWTTRWQEMKSIVLPLPSIEIQEEILCYVKLKMESVDSLIAIKQEKIEKLQEYKKSLIYEYVTGKKEVV